MKYVDGFVAAVETKKRDDYKKHIKQVAPVFKEFGAISIVECWGDEVPSGETTSFPMAVKCKDNETVVFSWITWPSKEKRDIGMKQVMNDPRVKMSEIPFDGKRLIYGGFVVLFEQHNDIE